MLAITTVDLQAAFGGRELAKGRRYVGEVTEFDLGRSEVSAYVAGSRPMPYRVVIYRRSGRIISVCTCPVGINCKHGAAVALRAIAASSAGMADTVRPYVADWLEELHSQLEPAPPARPPTQRHVLVWHLFPANAWQAPYLLTYKARLKKDGEPSGLEPWSNYLAALRVRPGFIDESDLAAIRTLWLESPRFGQGGPQVRLGGGQGRHAIELLAATGRLYSGPDLAGPLAWGDAREGQLEWTLLRSGEQVANLATTPRANLLINLESEVLYVDSASLETGEVRTGAPVGIVARLLSAPPLNPPEVAAINRILPKAEPSIPRPPENAAASLPLIDAGLQPRLRLATTEIFLPGYLRGSPAKLDLAFPEFGYGDIALPLSDGYEIAFTGDRQAVRLARDRAGENRALEELSASGLRLIDMEGIVPLEELPAGPLFGLASEEEWADFLASKVPALSDAGWKISIDPTFRHYRAEATSWHLDISASEGGWLSLDLGIEVDGERIDLPPLLAELFARDSRWLSPKGLEVISATERVELRRDGQPSIAIDAQRLKGIVATLVDLLSKDPTDLRLSHLDVNRLRAITEEGEWEVSGMERVLALARSLPGGAEVPEVAPPRGLRAELRPYQIAGVSWLQFLREHRLSGVLADDMGLGKTLQTLAHLLIEKEAGRLAKPALVVVPTTLVGTWMDEATRFTPGLSAIALHGSGRKEDFEQIPEHDIVITTYPLIWRDRERLATFEFHTIVLDEAQNIKNTRTKTSQAVRKIEAGHRLCLTGTPIENHLSELWSLFDFLLPGFLSDQSAFRRTWSAPIERHHNHERLDLLAQRLRPFILRRRKSQVATELPAKTITVLPIEIEGAQRDLYESVRSAMDERIRDEISERGFERSQIVILDALLKLRQVCCDPRLLRGAAAKPAVASAKRTALMEMLPELLEDGRRILLFSQFTGMLDLIKADLDQAGIGYVELRGDTRDRLTPVRRFQDLEVPLFLISLKAGGVGLNLTAADTVIHYDPWWNPATEDQATDRAHRIGQVNPVFVYKLIVAGSIEEKIVAMQGYKAELAAGILDTAEAHLAKFSAEDISTLLAPLP